MSQTYFTSNLAAVENFMSFNEFRRDCALLVWLYKTRPKIACYTNLAPHVIEKTFKDVISDLNKGIWTVKNDSNVGLKLAPNEVQPAHLRVYDSASFAYIDDLTFQLGYIILLSDCNWNVHVLDYNSSKIKRNVR